MKVSDTESSNFFKYHWYLSHIQDISMEWDSLMIIPQVKSIINIEVKSGPGINALTKAAKQTNVHQGILKKIFGAHLSPDWKFVKTTFTPNLSLKIEDSQPCGYCKMFMITDNQKIDDWIENIKHPHNIFTYEDYKVEYTNLLVGLIGYSSLHQSDTLKKIILDPQEFIQATKGKVTASDTLNDSAIKEDIGEDKHNSKSEYICYMLTPDQLMAVKDPSSHVIVNGDYGCGKTYVLKERTKQVAEKYPDEKIVYINLAYSEDFSKSQGKFNMMDMIAEKNFKDYKNVDVVTENDLWDQWQELFSHHKYILPKGKECCVMLEHFLKNSKYDHVFIDEMPFFVSSDEDVMYDFFFNM